MPLALHSLQQSLPQKCNAFHLGSLSGADSPKRVLALACLLRCCVHLDDRIFHSKVHQQKVDQADKTLRLFPAEGIPANLQITHPFIRSNKQNSSAYNFLSLLLQKNAKLVLDPQRPYSKSTC